MRTMQTSLLNNAVSNKSYIDSVREKIAMYGTEDATIQELLSLIMGQNNPDIVGRVSNLPVRELLNMTTADFQEIEGIGKATAERLQATMSLSKKIINQPMPNMWIIRSPEDVSTYMMDKMRHLPQEEFAVLCLDTKNKVTAEKTIFRGSLSASICHPREIFNFALKNLAASIVVLHQHPSGDPSPSQEDIEVTKRLVNAGKVIGIECLDHVIIGDGNFCSLKEKGYIN